MKANSSFDKWQANYAAHGVATFPVDANKRPMVSRYGKFGLIGSGKIARKFADAPAIGFMCGRRNGITSLDCDSKDACRSLGDIDTAMGCFKRSYEIDSFDPEIAALR